MASSNASLAAPTAGGKKTGTLDWIADELGAPLGAAGTTADTTAAEALRVFLASELLPLLLLLLSLLVEPVLLLRVLALARRLLLSGLELGSSEWSLPTLVAAAGGARNS